MLLTKPNEIKMGKIYLSEKVHGWHEADQAQVSINDWYFVDLLAGNDLHCTIVRPINDQIKEEYREKVVGRARSSRYTKVEAKDNVGKSNK